VDAVHAHNRKQLNAEVEIGHQSTAWCNLADVAIRVGQPYSRDAAMAAGQPAKAWTSAIESIEKHCAENGVTLEKDASFSPMLEFDAAAEQFTGDVADRANSFLRREYRQSFEVPTVA
jgi:hypothetical protein